MSREIAVQMVETKYNPTNRQSTAERTDRNRSLPGNNDQNVDEEIYLERLDPKGKTIAS